MAAAVFVEKVHGTVIGNIDICISIAVKVRQGNAEAASGQFYTGFVRYVGKASTIVAVEQIANWFVGLWPAIGSNAPLFAENVSIEIKVDVVGGEEVEIPVEIVVEKGRTRAPTAVANACLLGRIYKISTLISIECVGAKVGNVEVGIAIVVVVRCGYAHAVSHISSTHISPRECAVPSISVELVGWQRVRS